ncbi:MAG: hypothetical protein GY868_05430 [Deltaproteobacteria bacterium]|nr:hypothetical protein [Deltaproteobacteria bacterium]
MNHHLLLEELTGLIESCGVSTRRENLDESCGGLCTISGEKILFLDAHAAPEDLTHLCADVLARIIDIETIYLKPQTRLYIEQHIPAE